MDAIVLDKAVFTTVASGTLVTEAFAAGVGLIGGVDADDRIILNTTTGSLYYDVDGNGGGAAVQFATLTGSSTILTLTAADFLVVV